MMVSNRHFSVPSWTAMPILVLTLMCCIMPVYMVKHADFKTCDQSGFCKRNRQFADAAAHNSAWKSPYSLNADTIHFSDGLLTGTILKNLGDGNTVSLPVVVSFLESGSARITIDEEKRQKGEIELRHESKARKERYNEATNFAIVGSLKGSKDAKVVESGQASSTTIRYGPDGAFLAVVTHSPFGVSFQRNGVTEIQINERGLLNMEHWRPEPQAEPQAEPQSESQHQSQPSASESGENSIDSSTWFDESFGGSTDTKPRGPESIALDITFPGYEHVYGLPEHASSLSLKSTRGGDNAYTEPYRLYNLDVFEYELDSPMALYGHIPFMQAHKQESSVGVFWLSASETWVDVIRSHGKTNPLAIGVKGEVTTQTHWISESGVLDLFIFLGPTTGDVLKSYGELTGFTAMPQEFAIAYHQCRWNYVSDTDVIEVNKKFDKAGIPYDVIWLDIEYTDGKRYFTWDPLTFEHPEKMIKTLDKSDRKLVTIIDPHIKVVDGYHVVEELTKKDLAVHNKENNQYEGHCWPGNSKWVDCFNPAAIEWWKSLFRYKKFPGTGKNVFIWNDMNEPSVFNGPEVTMQKDNLHFGGWEHRDVHNVYGMTFHNATYQALLSRDKAEDKSPRRPFVLTRAFFAGSQRIGAMWTGDNLADWGHLGAALPMILNNGIGGFPFAGADVGGFFGNPGKELLTRWYQSGAFYPFFRAHAHIDTRRREPYLLGEPYTDIVSQALRLRYSLLPAWYTAFREAHVSGEPIVKPNFFVHPSDTQGFSIDDQLYLGRTGLLFKPIVTEGATSVDIYLADDTPYFDYFDYKIYKGKGKHNFLAPLDKMPLLMRAGHIIPRKDRARRSSGLMKQDPYTLVVVIGPDGSATGELYFDDGESFNYEQGAYVKRLFTFDGASNTLKSTDFAPEKGKLYEKFVKDSQQLRVERIIIINAPTSWKDLSQVAVTQGKKPEKTGFQYNAGKSGYANWAILKNPKVRITEDWTIAFA